MERKNDISLSETMSLTDLAMVKERFDKEHPSKLAISQIEENENW